MKRILLSLSILAGVATASTVPAMADTLTYNGFSEISGQDVFLSGSVYGKSGGLSATAGEIMLKNINSTTQSLLTFCVDVTHYLTTTGSFTTGGIIDGALGTTINALISNVVPNFGKDTNYSAALQVAIWEAKYGDSLTVYAPSAVLNDATTFLSNVAKGTWKADSNMQVALLAGNNGDQSQAYLVKAAQTATVPEPASMALLAAGLGATAFAARRRARI